MSIPTPLPLRRFFTAFASTALMFAALGSQARAANDIDIRTKQIWKLKYGVTDAQLADTAWLNSDLDGDGQKNGDEAFAGTSPFVAGSVLRITTITSSSSNVTVTFPTELGKQYVLQGSATLSGFGDLAPPVSVIGTGSPMPLTGAKGANKFFRVLVQDIDSDTDGVSDWAERAVTLNYLVAQTVPGTNDVDYVDEQIALPTVVKIMAAEPFASEDGPTPGRFTVTRMQNLFPITVYYGVTGSAVPGTDYTALGTSVSFAARGATSADIAVNPIVLAPLIKGGRSVTATLSPAGAVNFPFTLSPPNNTATVIINSSTTPTGTGLLARYYDTASATQADAANFGSSGTYVFTRGSPTNTGTIAVTAAAGQLTGLQVGHQVKLTFTSGNGAIDNATFDHQIYTVISPAPTATTFTVSITSASAFSIASTSGNCNFSIQSFPHPAVIERVDATVNNDWGSGTPNGAVISPNNSPENYSDTFDTYLQPSTAGNYTFQLDADDKARVLLDTGSGLTQIVEHNWDGPATVGTFKQSAPIALAVPATPAQRYHLRVEHVETTGASRCRLQWRLNSGGFANIPQGNQFTHTQAMTYTSGSDVVTVTPTGGHSLSVGSPVSLWFSSGAVFLSATNYNGDYNVATVNGTTSFTVNITGIPTQATNANGFVGNSASTTTGVFNICYANTGFTGSPGRVGVDGAVTAVNNGIWGEGTPDVALMQPDTFSVRWTGQVQPQFTEDYTFVVQADDGCSLFVNGQLQEMKTAPSTNQAGSTYYYDSTTGGTIVNYFAAVVKPGSFLLGESVRLDPTSGNLLHNPATPPTYAYDSSTGLAVIDYTNLTNGLPNPGATRLPGSYAVGETVELDPTSGSASALANLPYVITAVAGNTFTVSFGAGAFATGSGNITVADTRNAVITAVHAAGTGTYSYNTGTGTTTVTYSGSGLSGANPGSIVAGQTVLLDPTSGNLGSLAYAPLVVVAPVTATTFTVTFPTGLGTGTGTISILDPANAPIPSAAAGFTVNFGAGKYANASTGAVSVETVNKPLKEWSSMGNERYVRIPVIGGTRYDIQLDYYENASYSRSILSWYSPSQPKQVIPQERLYPSSQPVAPPAHITATDATALVNGTFNLPIAGSNLGAVTVSGLPPGLGYSGGVLTGTPSAGSAGDYQVVVTITNDAGSSSSVVNLHVEDTGGVIVREYWSGVNGNTVASIPVTTAPTGTGNLTSLAGPTNSGTNYGARIRGYITAPATGNYYFWIAANNAAELWISNDDEPINALKRASVVTGSATPQDWTAEPNQKSPWLALEQGRKYYVEILHKAGAGGGDNLAVGWLKPGETGAAPSQVVPGYVLSPYVAPSAGPTSGTLYVATMLAQPGAVGNPPGTPVNGVGTSTLRLSADENFGYMRRSYSGLTGPISQEHIHTDPYLAKPSTIVFDIDAPATPGDGLITNPSDPNYTGTDPQTGTYKWTIVPVGVLTKADIIEIIKEGKAYINLHTATNGAGEIRGNYTLSNGTQTFTPPPAPPAWTDDHTTDAGAVRFLTQATFGANTADIAALKSMASYEAWIDDQINNKGTTQHLPEVLAREIADVFGPFDVRVCFNTWWKSSMTAPDQLRQKVAFALSQIHVVSGQGPLEDNSRAIADFYDTLAANAFGNFRDVLMDTTLTPAMGRYLDMLRNDKPDLSVGRIPNENYAREIKQLFSIGLYRMWPDGTLMLSSKDSPIDTYSQREIVGLSHVFTGWDYGYDGDWHAAMNAPADWTRPMRAVPARHFTGPKRVLNNEVLPGLTTVDGQPLDPYATHVSTNYNNAAYKALPDQENNVVHDMLFNHPNTGPFICRQLIQRLVTSNPSRDYLYRVVQKFNDNGSGVRGDMKAVIKAILLDYEARSSDLQAIPAYGKQREPIQRVANAARAFRPANVSGTYAQTGSNTIAITTTTPHLLATGNSVFLEFTDATPVTSQPAPTTGTYVATVTDATHFTIPAPGWMTGTYSQSGTTITVTMNGHWLPGVNASQPSLPAANWGRAYFDFTSGPANGVASFDQSVLTLATSTSFDTPSGVGNVSGTTFTLTAPYSATATNQTVMISRFPGSYSCTGRAGVITVDTAYGGVGTYGLMADHGLSTGDSVFINFANSRDTTSFNETSTENDIVYTITGTPDPNTFTVAARDAANAAMNSDNQAFIFPHKAQPLVRNGTVSARPSTYTMDNTDTDLQQTPLDSPTVFNFFLPDYKFAGTLASQGMTTPEFQLTSETTVIRQANFLYNGIFNPNSTTGISSFKSGTNALVMDLSPWMGNAVGTSGPGLVLGPGPQTGQVWTSNANLPTLIDRMNTLLLANQLPADAKKAIVNFVGRQISSIATGSPCTITLVDVGTGTEHGLQVGDSVTVTGITGGTFSGASTTGNGTFTVVSVPTTSTFKLTNMNCSSISGLNLANSTAGIVSYTNTSPSATNIRDRLRAIVHFILTSPDFTIQR